jgi:hypothetical protein
MEFDYTGGGEAVAARPKRMTAARVVALVLGAVGVAVLASVALVMASVVALFTFGDSFETRSLEDYGVYEGHIEAEDALFSYSDLLIFPERLPAEAKVNDFLYACSTKGLDNSYQLLLDYQLPPDAFEDEVARLRGLSVSYDGKTNHVIYDTESFPYPACVTVYAKDGDREFALIDEKNHRIIAVLAMKGRGSLDGGLFAQDPVEYAAPIDWLGYSLYQFEVADGVADKAR